MYTNLCTYTHDVCIHMCVPPAKKRERDTPKFQLWLPALGAGISDDVVLSITLPCIYQVVY